MVNITIVIYCPMTFSSFTTGYGEHSVRYLGPVLWSKIDRKLREPKTVDQFKREIRKVDLAKHILPNKCIDCTLCIVIIFKFVGGIIERL